MADLESPYRLILGREFKKKTQKNKRYSLRAFAKFLEVDPTYLSKLFSGKLLLSLDTAEKLTRRLKLSQDERATFLISAAEEQRCHALYLIDPSLTPCDLERDGMNQLPLPRKKKNQRKLALIWRFAK